MIRLVIDPRPWELSRVCFLKPCREGCLTPTPKITMETLLLDSFQSLLFLIIILHHVLLIIIVIKL